MIRYVFMAGFGASIGAAAMHAVRADAIGAAFCLIAAGFNLEALRHLP